MFKETKVNVKRSLPLIYCCLQKELNKSKLYGQGYSKKAKSEVSRKREMLADDTHLEKAYDRVDRNAIRKERGMV